MRAKPTNTQADCLDFYPLEAQINLKHPLVLLAKLIDWQSIDDVCSQHFPSKRGRTATPSRLIAGLVVNPIK